MEADSSFSRGRSLVFAVWIVAAIACTVASCTNVERRVVPPPNVPGADFVGTEACGICHEDIAARFTGAIHDVLRGGEPATMNVGCEACHGPGSAHVEAGGGAGSIIHPGDSPQSCFSCHLDVRGDFSLPHKHPVTTGPMDLTEARMRCVDCHNPHSDRSAATAGTPMFAGRGTAQACTDCHAAQRGPWVFEHEAMREGCETCHQPHGSVNPKMLAATNATLCLTCHFQEQPRSGVVMIGGQDHSLFLSQGTCYTAGCHEAVHGSQVSPSLRF